LCQPKKPHSRKGCGPARAISRGRRSEVNSNCRYRFVKVRRRHQVKLCGIETNCKVLSRCSAFLVRFRVTGSDQGKMACPFIGTLLRHQSRRRSSRTRGMSPSNVADRISRPRRSSVGRFRQFVWAPRTRHHVASGCSEIGSGNSNSPRSATQSQVSGVLRKLALKSKAAQHALDERPRRVAAGTRITRSCPLICPAWT
jgi:hypothetical protein